MDLKSVWLLDTEKLTFYCLIFNRLHLACISANNLRPLSVWLTGLIFTADGSFWNRANFFMADWISSSTIEFKIPSKFREHRQYYRCCHSDLLIKIKTWTFSGKYLRWLENISVSIFGRSSQLENLVKYNLDQRYSLKITRLQTTSLTCWYMNWATQNFIC